MVLEKIIDVQRVGCFEKLRVPGGLRFSKLTLIFGENGWGKSTIADILRSLTTDDPRILTGRETLASAGGQKVILLVDGKQAEFDGTRWRGVCPKVAVYDQIFINQNVFSGDTVSHDHLKRQYGLVVGEKGVTLMRDIIALDAEQKDVNTQIRQSERAIQAALTTLGLDDMTIDRFVAHERADGVDALISKKDQDVQRASRADDIGKALLPELLLIPSESATFRGLLAASIDGVAADARQRMREHIERHRVKDGAAPSLTHEVWLATGLSFEPQDPCPYCGQELHDGALIDAYERFFSDAYKQLAEQVRRCRATLQRHISGEFTEVIRQALRNIETLAASWKALAAIESPAISSADAALTKLRAAAAKVDELCEIKQADLVAPVASEELNQALQSWGDARHEFERINAQITAYKKTLEEVKKTQESANLPKLRQELAILRGRKRRYEKDIVADIAERAAARKRKTEIESAKEKMRTELTSHTKTVTEGLGATINAYLDRLGAGFRIDYQSPNYRGNEPAASYNILINNVPIPPRTAHEDVSQPTFKNTLSAGDKSVLALAIFLATLRTRSDLGEIIVVLDDPFTSLDEFRRTFTVNEINKLLGHASQIIVLSHEKNFLRLIWDTIEQSQITSLSIQTGAPGVASLAAFDLEAATRPRYVSERMEVEDFYQLTKGSSGHIRALLRKVLENFYRQGDPDLFAPDELLDGIIRKLRAAPPDHRYKAAVEDLEEINRYTRNFHHAPVEGSVCEDTNIEELKTYCRRVISLTRGSP